MSDEDGRAAARVRHGERLLPAILGVLDVDALARIVRAIGLFLPASSLETSESLVRELTAIAPPIDEVVGALADDDLLAACSAVGIEVLDQDLDVLRVRLAGHSDPWIESDWWWIT